MTNSSIHTTRQVRPNTTSISIILLIYNLFRHPEHRALNQFFKIRIETRNKIKEIILRLDVRHQSVVDVYYPVYCYRPFYSLLLELLPH